MLTLDAQIILATSYFIFPVIFSLLLSLLFFTSNFFFSFFFLFFNFFFIYLFFLRILVYFSADRFSVWVFKPFFFNVSVLWGSDVFTNNYGSPFWCVKHIDWAYCFLHICDRRCITTKIAFIHDFIRVVVTSSVRPPDQKKKKKRKKATGGFWVFNDNSQKTNKQTNKQVFLWSRGRAF